MQGQTTSRYSTPLPLPDLVLGQLACAGQPHGCFRRRLHCFQSWSRSSEQLRKPRSLLLETAVLECSAGPVAVTSKRPSGGEDSRARNAQRDALQPLLCSSRVAPFWQPARGKRGASRGEHFALHWGQRWGAVEAWQRRPTGGECSLGKQALAFRDQHVSAIMEQVRERGRIDESGTSDAR